MYINFVGLTGTGKTTSNSILFFLKDVFFVDSDLLFDKYYSIKNVDFLKKKTKERLFRIIESSIDNFLIYFFDFFSFGGGFYISYNLLNCFLIKNFYIFETSKILPTFCMLRNKEKKKINKKLFSDRIQLIKFISFKKI